MALTMKPKVTNMPDFPILQNMGRIMSVKRIAGLLNH
jgi:hypothetical protein